MTHWRQYMDSEVIRAVDLGDQKWTFKITGVRKASVVGANAKKTTRPFLNIEGQTKPLVVNSTNGRTIETLYGDQIENWVGKWIEIYAAPTTFGGAPTMGIRVSPKAPEPKKGKEA